MRDLGLPIWIGEFGPLYNGTPQQSEERYRLLQDQLDIYRDHQASWALWTYKDIGLQGVVHAAADSPYRTLLEDFLVKKGRLGADSWGGTDEHIRAVGKRGGVMGLNAVLVPHPHTWVLERQDLREEAAGAIDRVDGDGGQSQLLRGFDDTSAAAALVFHLVAQIGNRLARAFGGNFLFQICRDAFIGHFDPRFDLADLDQRHTELARYRLADLAGGQREGRIRDRGIDDLRFRHQSEIDVGGLQSPLLRQIVE